MAAGEGQQVMALISKRLRALRKKYNKITAMEESISQGKTLNKDQEEILRSKPVVTALIEELEKLRLPLPTPSSASISEETNQQQKARKKMADEEDVTAKAEIEDSKISDGVNVGEVSKENSSSACCKKPRRKRKSKRPTSKSEGIAP